MPEPPLAKKSKLQIEHKYLGYGKNSEGVLGMCGQLFVTLRSGEALKGSLETSNPLLFLSPTSLKGYTSTITYWMPPAAFPHPSGQLTVKTTEETQSLPINSLFPKSRSDYWSDSKVVAALAIPAVLGVLYFLFVFWHLGSGVDSQVERLFPSHYASAIQGTEPAGFLTRSFGLYQLEVVPAGESLQLIWAAIIFFVPLLASKVFANLSKPRQRRYGGLLAACQLFPTVALLGIWNLQSSLFPLFSHPDLAPLDLGRFLNWGLPLNVGVALYLFLSVFGVWDRVFKVKELRFLLPILLTCCYAILIFVLIFGRSWTS